MLGDGECRGWPFSREDFCWFLFCFFSSYEVQTLFNTLRLAAQFSGSEGTVRRGAACGRWRPHWGVGGGPEPVLLLHPPSRLALGLLRHMVRICFEDTKGCVDASRAHG